MALLAPGEVARTAEVYAEAIVELGKQIQAAGGWDGTQIGAQWDVWKRAEGELIKAARQQLGVS